MEELNKEKYYVICRKVGTSKSPSSDTDVYQTVLNKRELYDFVRDLETKKFIHIDGVFINTNDVARVVKAPK